MLSAPCYILADAHLGAADPALERQLVDFVRALRGRTGSLLINGDLFEFWFEWRRVIPRGHFRVLRALAELHESGVRAVLTAGNHDCWGGEFLTHEVGLEYRMEPWTGELAGWHAHIAHGDGLRPVLDRGYRMLRAVIRHPLAVRAFRLVHPDLGSRLAQGSSHASRTYRPRDGGRGVRDAAIALLDGDPSLELAVLGHSHVAALERARTGGVYANPGAWMDAPTFLKVTPERIELRRFTGATPAAARGDSAEGELLDALDRRPEKALAHA